MLSKTYENITFKYKIDLIEKPLEDKIKFDDESNSTALLEKSSENLILKIEKDLEVRQPSKTINRILDLRRLATIGTAALATLQITHQIGNNFDQKSIRELDKAAYSSQDKITKKSPLFELETTKQILASGNEIADELVGKTSFSNFRRIFVTDSKSGKGVIFLPAKDIADIDKGILHAGEIKNEDGSLETFEEIYEKFAASLRTEIRKEAKERRAIVDLPIVLEEKIQPVKNKYFSNLAKKQEPFSIARAKMLAKLADNTAAKFEGKYKIKVTPVTANQTIDRTFTNDYDLHNPDRNVIGGNEIIRFEFEIKK
jgi:hypothetical protein